MTPEDLSKNPTAEELVALSKALRRTLDPWIEDDMPVGPSTRVRQQFVRCLSLTELPIIKLQYLKGILSRGEPNGWELYLPGHKSPLFLKGKKSGGDALHWADQHLSSDGWIFAR